MPINPNILLQSQPIPTMMDRAAQQAQLDQHQQRAALTAQQLQMGSFDLEERKRESQRNEALRQAYQQAGGDPQKMLEAVMQHDPIAGMKLQAQIAELQTHALKAKELQASVFANATEGATPENWSARYARIVSTVGPQSAQAMGVSQVYDKDAIDAARAIGIPVKDQVGAQIKEMELLRKQINDALTASDKTTDNERQQAALDLLAKHQGVLEGHAAAQLRETQRHNRTEEGQRSKEDTAISLTPEGLDVTAENYFKTGQLPPMGMGKQGAGIRSRIINRAAELHPGFDLASNRAGYSSDTGSLKTLQKSRDAIGAFEQTAAKNIDIFLDTAGKVVDTGSPLANTLVRSAAGKLLGSPNQAAYDAARQVAINEVAKITSNPNMAGTLSDSARHEVEAFNPNSATLKQTVAVMRILKRDMANRTSALDQQIAAIKGRIGGSQADAGVEEWERGPDGKLRKKAK